MCKKRLISTILMVVFIFSTFVSTAVSIESNGFVESERLEIKEPDRSRNTVLSQNTTQYYSLNNDPIQKEKSTVSSIVNQDSGTEKMAVYQQVYSYNALNQKRYDWVCGKLNEGYGIMDIYYSILLSTEFEDSPAQIFDKYTHSGWDAVIDELYSRNNGIPEKKINENDIKDLKLTGLSDDEIEKLKFMVMASSYSIKEIYGMKKPGQSYSLLQRSLSADIFRFLRPKIKVGLENVKQVENDPQYQYLRDEGFASKDIFVANKIKNLALNNVDLRSLLILKVYYADDWAFILANLGMRTPFGTSVPDIIDSTDIRKMNDAIEKTINEIIEENAVVSEKEQLKRTEQVTQEIKSKYPIEMQQKRDMYMQEINTVTEMLKKENINSDRKETLKKINIAVEEIKSRYSDIKEMNDEIDKAVEKDLNIFTAANQKHLKQRMDKAKKEIENMYSTDNQKRLDLIKQEIKKATDEINRKNIGASKEEINKKIADATKNIKLKYATELEKKEMLIEEEYNQEKSKLISNNITASKHEIDRLLKELKDKLTNKYLSEDDKKIKSADIERMNAVRKSNTNERRADRASIEYGFDKNEMRSALDKGIAPATFVPELRVKLLSQGYGMMNIHYAGYISQRYSTSIQHALDLYDELGDWYKVALKLYKSSM